MYEMQGIKFGFGFSFLSFSFLLIFFFALDTIGSIFDLFAISLQVCGMRPLAVNNVLI